MRTRHLLLILFLGGGELLSGGDARADLVARGVDRFADGETVVRYAQTHEGLPVIGRGSMTRYAKTGAPIASRDAIVNVLPSTTPTLTPRDAAKIALARPDEAHLVIWPTFDRGARLAYAVVPRIPAGVPAAPRVIVDAQTGEVLEARDLLVFANEAKVYRSNPTKSPEVVTETFAMAPVGGVLTNPFLVAHNCIDKKSVKALSFGGFDVDVHVCDLEQVAKADRNGDFLYEPSDAPGSAAARSDAFSEVSIYHHATKAYAFFRDLQGDPGAQVVVDEQLRLIANLQVPKGIFQGDLASAADPNKPLETFQNAFYSPAAGGLGGVFAQLYGFDSGALWFGQGPKRDYAYDGDVVYHELTHAVVEHSLGLGVWHVDEHGAIDAPGAMNEGLADYFSSAITGDPDVGEYAASDFGSTTGVIRTLANKDKCTNVVGEVHVDSTLFSGGLWEARESLPARDRATFDKAIYKAMRANPGQADVGFEDVVALFLAVLKTDFPAGETALAKTMKDRGVLVDGKGCDRVLAWAGKPIASPQRRLGFIAPGKQSVSVNGLAPGVVQIKAKVPAGATKLKVSFTARAGGAGPANPLGGQATPFAPVVLLKVGGAIAWSANGHDADAKATAKPAPGDAVATFTLPEKTGDTYVQIANNGDSDGAYDDLALEFSTDDGTVVGGDDDDDDANGPGSGAPGTTTTITETTCGISTPGAAFGGGTWLLGLGALGAARAVARRRKNPQI
ncbi:MAG: hypothetical protein KIT84_05025 [Labilithrix sp.]|nr:hypothetical protein [Labilithrix sp.]MCW5810350.1 hypothetical protein [Labilithrix sp.]